MRDLWVTTFAPVLGTGRALRSYGVVRALATGGPVELLYVPFEGAEPGEEYRAIDGVSFIPVEVSRGARRATTYARARLRRIPAAFARGVSPELIAASERAAARPDVRRVIADGPAAAAALLLLGRQRPVIYNAHNLESDFRHSLAVSGFGSRRSLTAFERALLESAQESWMVSERDMETARALCPGAMLRHVPNVVDVEAIKVAPARAGERAALFVADFAYQPNRSGLRFLLDEVFPRVWRELPDARLVLAGRGLDQLPSSDGRVEVLGFVPDLPGVYGSCACALVPLLEGGGSPLKFVEALAYGLPAVATPRAAAGLDQARSGQHYREGEGAEAFAAQVIDVLRDGDVAMAARGRRLAEEAYSIEALARAIAA